jgi:selenocysteine lyase/cysteine desulfurase
MNRRSFLYTAGAAAIAFRDGALERLQAAAAATAGSSAQEAARNEDFWFEVRHAFTIDRNIINLNNGGVSPAPRIVQEAMDRYLEMSNMAPVYYMWRLLDPQLESVRRLLAQDFGCDPEEIAITRNASESLEICQFGIDLKRGDEVITTNQDYPRMLTTWRQRELRDGIVVKQVKFPVPPSSLDDLASRIEEAITPRTKVILVCHITNRTGQIFPVQKICRMGRERGIEVIVDGAHSYAQFPFKLADLDCDYFGTSLHKWLLAPIGTGFLYVRRAKIAKLWSLMGSGESNAENIRKFEEIGTHPAANQLAIAEAMTFHQSIGVERKAARLRYLRERWSRRLEQLPGVRTLTSYDPAQSCGIGLLSIAGMDHAKLTNALWEKHRILVTSINTEGEYEGIRVTPNVYTTLAEVDRFCEVIEGIVRNG